MFLQKNSDISGWMLTKCKISYTPYTTVCILTKLKMKKVLILYDES